MTGCCEETDLYFYTDQSWKVETALTVDEAIMDLAMGVGGTVVGSEFGIPIPNSLLESENWIGLSLDYIVAEYRNQGLEAKWREKLEYLYTGRQRRRVFEHARRFFSNQ